MTTELPRAVAAGVMKQRDTLTLGTSLGSVMAALLATLGTVCCLGPFVVATLGVSGAVAAASIAPYQPYLLAGAVALLAVGFWRSYRGKACTTDACQKPTGRIALWIAAFITGGAAIFPALVGP